MRADANSIVDASPITVEPPKYRRDIDGLRAFSILSVVIFHAFPRALPGGFIGVDVFFVISGFLISGIILKSLNDGTFSYATFYSRRIKRIFPALIVVLVAFTLVGWLFLFQDEWKSLEKHIFAGAAFLSNIALMREGGYFDLAAKPMLHLWSLGIEEQFYIAWPLLLALTRKRRSAALPSILLVLSISFALNLWCVQQRPSVAFYFPAMRFWELALGALLAHAMLFRSKERLPGQSVDLFANPRLSSILSFVGLSLLVASLLLIDENRAFPGLWALLPTTGAFFTIAAGPKAWFNRVALSSRPMVFLGLISYPLYLWHWPLLVFAKLLNPMPLSWPITIGAVVVAITLSSFTYRFVETPLRHHGSVHVPRLLAASVAVIGMFGLVCFYKVNSWPRLQSSKSGRAAAEASVDGDYPFVYNFLKHGDFRTGQVEGGTGEKLLFIGDSHAEQYYDRVKVLSESRPDQFLTSVFATHGGCPPLPRMNRIAPGFACDKFFDYAIARASDSQVKTVVFCAYWEYYFGYQEDGDKLSLLYHTGDDPRMKRPAIQSADLAFTDFGTAIRLLTARGKHVFVILSTPASSLYNPRKMVSRITGAFDPKNLDRKTLERARPILERLKAVSVESGATVIDPIPYFCGDSICKTTTEEGLPLYRDDDHLRSSYVSRYATFVDQVYKK